MSPDQLSPAWWSPRSNTTELTEELSRERSVLFINALYVFAFKCFFCMSRNNQHFLPSAVQETINTLIQQHTHFPQQTLVTECMQWWREDLRKISLQRVRLPGPDERLDFGQQTDRGSGVSHPQCITAPNTVRPCLCCSDRGRMPLPHRICYLGSSRVL